MIHYNQSTIQNWERFYRANLLQCITGFKSANLIGTINAEGVPNVAIFSSVVHLGSNPALVGYINRPIAAATHTLANIEATRVYTINHVTTEFTDKAHQTSAKYALNVNEFDATGLTMEFIEGIKAPFVKESNIQYAVQLVEIVPIRHNQTFFVIGSITDIILKTITPASDGFVAIEKAGSMACLGADAYYTGQLIQRYRYAKPNEPTQSILQNIC
jgi:flavin reductase (DIM6/NTAB) family NADH-FMN oxidoreductase RutF